MAKLELHGYVACPYAWRTRIAAAEKGVPFDWIPCDVEDPDPRVGHNPDRRSPLLYDPERATSLVESFVICQFIDEAFEGKPLQPRDALERARMRLDVAQIAGKLEVHEDPSEHRADHKKIDAGLDALEQRLVDGRAFLAGDAPALADVQIWPFLCVLEKAYDFGIGRRRPHVAAYFGRVEARPGYLDTRPPWAR